MEEILPMKTFAGPQFDYIVNTGELSIEALKSLECPGCHKISPPPIYLCEAGHSICTNCMNRLPNCPKCGSPFIQTRNDLAEALISQLLFKCPNWKIGCKFASPGGSELEKHLDQCCYGGILCIVGSGIGCGKVIGLREFEDHLKEVHNIGGAVSPKAIINMSTSVDLGSGSWTFPPHYLKAFGQTFLGYVHASQNVLLFWITLCGGDEELSKYAGSITLFHSDQKLLRANWTGPVHRIRTTLNDIYESGNCLAIIPESFLLFAEISYDKTNRKLINWKCLFEIIELNPKERKVLKRTYGCGCPRKTSDAIENDHSNNNMKEKENCCCEVHECSCEVVNTNSNCGCIVGKIRESNINISDIYGKKFHWNQHKDHDHE